MLSIIYNINGEKKQNREIWGNVFVYVTTFEFDDDCWLLEAGTTVGCDELAPCAVVTHAVDTAHLHRWY